MTKSEIIKAFECCIVSGNCHGCPLWNERTTECLKVAIKNAIDLINRENAEIELLENESKRQATKAIKEFVERVKESIAALEYRANTHRKTVKVEELREQIDWVLHTVIPQTIDQIAKEMGVEL